MVAVTLRFGLRQPFRRSAARAYAWCTDYRSDDHARQGEPGRRKVERLTKSTLLLTDTTPGSSGRPIRKTKLIQLDPKRLSWTNTHLTGPTRLSQFWYRIVPRGHARSSLEFEAFQVEYPRSRPSPAALRARALRIRKQDRATWRRLARSMDSDPAG
jgi:hypothetical protein